MSGAQTSSFYPVNQLLQDNAQQLANQYAPQRNALFVQKTQQEIGAREIEVAASLAQGLLGLGDEAAMAAAYPGAVAYGQQQGFLKNAPSVFPGMARLKQIAAMGVSAEKQAEIAGNKEGWGQLFNDDTGAVPAQAPAAVTPPATAATPPAAADAPAVAPQQQSNARPGGSPALTSIAAPGGAKVTVASAVAPRFQGLVNDLEAAGYTLDPKTTGGYNPRNIAGTNTPSHHASGNAIDVNWQRNARGANTPSDLPPELARKLAAKHGLVWGGDWTGETRDPMHFEIAGATRTGGGIGARIPGAYNVAGSVVAAPGATVAPAAAPPGQQSGRGMLEGLRPDQIQQLRALRAAGRPFSEGLTLMHRFRVENQSAAQHAQTEQRLLKTETRLEAEARQRQEKADRDAAAANEPFGGTGEDNTAKRVLRRLRTKMLDGTATEEDRADYALAVSHFTRPGPPQWMPDPNDPTKQVLASVPGEIPEGFPAPNFRPGGAIEAGGSRGPKVVPGTSRPAALTEGQGKAATFAGRMEIAAPVMDDLDNATTYAQRGLEGAGKYLGYNLNTPEYQRLRTAQEAFLSGILRNESGAAVSKEEWERYAHLYFPMPGEDVETAKLKRQIRQSMLEGMVREAGPGYKPVAKAPVSDQSNKSALPQEAISHLKEGIATKFPNGQTWTLRNGKPEQVK